MTTDAETAKKRTPKRLSADALKDKIKARIEKGDYRGATLENIQWDTLRYDETKRKQVVDIKTVDGDGNPDGDTRTVATSDLHLVKHSINVSKALQKERSNARRRKAEAEKASADKTDEE